MNEALINPFNTLSHPTSILTSIPAQAHSARFDPTGRFIATARNNGSAHLWDLETRNSVRWLDGHVKPVTSSDWSRNGRYFLTSSKDWNVVVWDLACGVVDPPQRGATMRFDAPVVSASFHPKNSRIVLVLLTTGEAFVCDTRKATKSRTMLKEITDEESDEEGESSSRARSYMTVARFDPSGKHIFIGTSNGMILVFRTRTKTMIARHRIAGANVMKAIEFTKSGRRFVTNSSDRTLRYFVVPTYPDTESSQAEDILETDLEPTHRFNDPINKTAWHAMAFSPDGEWLAGGAADPAAHKIYIWDLSNDGQFTSTLDGGREPLIHLHWHPTKSTLSSTTNLGNVLIWHAPNPERWGAFAGGFEEVDENVEYEEREDEFDVEDEQVILERKMKAEEEDVDIDSMAIAVDGHGAGGVGGQNPGSATSPTTGHPPPTPTMIINGITPNRTVKTEVTPLPTPGTDTESEVTTRPTATPGKAGDGDAVMSPVGELASSNAGGAAVIETDPDILWAQEEPDDDLPSLWRMKIVMEEDEDE
ncbi:WD40-repeat-containing domain protein [Coprinopsis sp. MPI-PUGE-AT-0042]|nr:WD40-repeat-containing domain protein [Coprinopsis sp. MPI-PUGE-AT-0042]